ncbi:MAG: hypothetical protein P9L92_10255 [Candidatus Electryonea clarkiae]|nr:hypothetical protein [Candidatus Electryonea clarkiae]
MILTIDRQEINALLNKHNMSKVEISVEEMGDDRMVIAFRWGIVYKIELTGFSCENNVISAGVKSKKLSFLLKQLKDYISKYSIIYENNRISSRLPDMISDQISIKKVMITSEGIKLIISLEHIDI